MPNWIVRVFTGTTNAPKVRDLLQRVRIGAVKLRDQAQRLQMALGPTILGQDTFIGRTTSGNWGTASDGVNVWSYVRGTIGITLSVGSGLGSASGNSSSFGVVRCGTGTSADTDQIVTFKRTSSADCCGVVARYTDPNNYYVINIGAYTNNLVFSKMVAGSNTDVAFGGSVTPTLADYYSIRFRCVGTTIQARLWDATLTEPTSWDINTTDTTFSGALGYGITIDPAGATAIVVNNYVATNAAIAMMPVQRNLVQRFLLLAVKTRDQAQRLRLGVTPLRDITTRFIVAASLLQTRDQAQRLRVQVTNLKNIPQRLVLALASVQTRDLVQRLRLQGTTLKDIPQRLRVLALTQRNIVQRLLLKAQLNRDLVQRLLVLALTQKNVPQRLFIGITNLKNLSQRVLLKAITSKDLSQRFRIFFMALSYKATVLADGATSYYELDEASGTSAFDSSGNAHTGTYSGSGVTYSQPGAIRDMTDTCVSFATGQVALPIGINPTGSFSFEFWMKVSAYPGSNCSVVANWSSVGGTQQYGFGVGFHTNGTLRFEYATTINSTTAITSSALTTGIWHQVVATWDTTTMTLYLDGSLVGTVVPASTQLALGQLLLANSSYGDYYPGLLDEVSFYPNVLTSTQVANHYTLALISAKNLGQRLRVLAVGSKDLAQRVRVSVTTLKNIPQRLLLQALAQRNVSQRLRLQVTNLFNMPQRLLLSLTTLRNQSQRLLLKAQINRDLAQRLSFAAVNLVQKNLSQRFVLLAVKVRDVPQRLRLQSTNSKDIGQRVRLSVTNLKNIPHRLIVQATRTRDEAIRLIVAITVSRNLTQRVIIIAPHLLNLFHRLRISAQTLRTMPLRVFVSAVKMRDMLSRFVLTTPYKSYKAVVIADNPIRYYQMNETSGTTAIDSTPLTPHNGTYIGGYTLNQTHLLGNDPGGSVLFNGTSGYVSLSTTSLPTGASPWSIECWCRFSSLPTGYVALAGMGNRSAQQMATLFGYNTNQFVLSTFAGDIYSGTTIATNKNYHVVGSYDGTNIRLYVNGALDAGPSAYTMNLTQNFASIGADGSTQVDWLPGYISEVAYYNYALTLGQISNHYLTGQTDVKNVSLRLVLSSLSQRNIPQRLWVQATNNKNIAARLRLIPTAIRDLPQRFLLKALRVSDCVMRARFVPCRNLSTRFGLYQPGIHQQDMSFRLCVTAPFVTMYTTPLRAPEVSYAGSGGMIPLPSGITNRIYTINTLQLDTPTVCTTPIGATGLMVPAGSSFILVFNNPSARTQDLLINNAIVPMSFLLYSGESVSGQVILSVTQSGTNWQALCTTIAPIQVQRWQINTQFP